jgi:hypothetical protein
MQKQPFGNFNCGRRLLFFFIAFCMIACSSVLAAEISSDTSADDESAKSHLQKALAYYESGEYATAILEFETVLQLDDLPADLHQQAEIYAGVAEEYLAGRRLQPTGYAIIGFGNYRENSTSAGSGETDDNFLKLRVGGRLNYTLSEVSSLNGTLDYRFREYNDGDRRRDSDLRWNGSYRHRFDDNNLTAGVRGRVSYRGDGDYRNDYGVFSTYRILLDENDQLTLGAEYRRRSYPEGRLRSRSRNIAELDINWTRSLMDGKASFSLDAFGGWENATQNRLDGNSSFYGLSPTYNFTLNDQWGGYVFFWWQHDSYNSERYSSEPPDDAVAVATRADDLYELGGGLTWEFGDGWSLNPEILYVEDNSNILAVNYSSTEIWLTLRYDF